MINENTVIEFDYTKEAITKIVEDLKDVDRTDFAEVKDALSKLVKIRTTITEQGKTYRDSANAYNKSVLSKEKEYLELTSELEADLKQSLDDEKQRLVVEARKELLPMKREQLDMLTFVKTKITDEEILALDDQEWVTLLQNAMEENKREMLVEDKKLEEEAGREEREAKIAEQARIDLIEAQKQKEIDDGIAETLRVAKEKEEMEADEKYQNFLSENKYDAKTDIIKGDNSEIKIYRLIATFTK